MPERIEKLWENVAAGWANAQPMLGQIEAFLSNPWVRVIGLVVIVYFTIRVIASVYSGDKQNSELGPVAIRQHSGLRDTIILPRVLMPMNMDGVSAKLKVYYVFNDSRGKRRKQLLHENARSRIAVSPVALRAAAKIDGQEVPDVASADVCFPPVDMDKAPSLVPATPDRAIDYVALHKIIENWHEDDNAPLISMHPEIREQIRADRERWIVEQANKVRREREGNFIQKLLSGSAARRRPNVIGSYYIKLEFSHDPWFVLTRHPDRDLKMTAWLTVLTSMFALVMDVWPKAPAEHADLTQQRPAAHSSRTSARPVVPH